MEIVKYLCEFFFGNFWHWLGLIFVLLAILPSGLIRINVNKNDETENSKASQGEN